MNLRSSKPVVTHAGFSLLELIVVMAIMAILAAMALPLFLSKIPREQIEGSLPLLDPVMKKVEKYYNDSLAKKMPALPANNVVAEAGTPESYAGVFVESITIVDGAVNVKFRPTANAKLAGKIVSWRPTVAEGSPMIEKQWICGYQKEPPRMQIGGTNATNVTRDALPLKCL